METPWNIWVRTAASSVGLMANTLAILVILHGKLKNTSVGVYLAALSSFDNLALISIFTLDFSPYLSGINLIILNDVSCRILFGGFVMVHTMSSWTLTAFTVERSWVIVKPYPIAPLALRKRAFIVIFFIILGSFSLHMQTFFTYKVVSVPIVANNTTEENVTIHMQACGYAPQFEHFGYNIFSWISVIMYSGLPVIIMVFCNITVIVAICKHSRNMQLQESKNNVSASREKFIPLMLANNIFFLITTLPMDFYYNFAFLWYDDVIEAANPKHIHLNIMLILNILNYCCNPFIYLLSGKRFREEAKNFAVSCWRGLIGGCFNDTVSSGVPSASESTTNTESRIATVL